MKIILSILISFFVVNTSISQNTTQKKDSVINYTDINGKKQGPWLKKYDNGNPAYKAYFINDIPVGEYIRYYYSGGIKAKINYDKNGNGKAILYWDDGTKMAEGNYVNIKLKDSIWNMYGTDGALMLKIGYSKGFKNGKEIKYFRNKYPSEVITWKNGWKDGVWRWYYDNGQVRMETKYVKGIQEGPFRVYYDTGVFYITGQYKNNRRDGIWKYYDYYGKVEKEIEYKNGIASNAEEMSEELNKKLKEWEENKGKIPEPTIESLMNSGRRQ